MLQIHDILGHFCRLSEFFSKTHLVAFHFAFGSCKKQPSSMDDVKEGIKGFVTSVNKDKTRVTSFMDDPLAYPCHPSFLGLRT